MLTKRGIAIGSLFILDDKPREPMNPEGLEFMVTMARTIVGHFEIMKEKEDRRRELKMNLCLTAFVDPHHAKRQLRPLSTSRDASKEPASRNGKEKNGKRTTSDSQSNVDSSSESTADDGRTVDTHGSEPDFHSQTLQRAASLLCEALDLQGGGVSFVGLPASIQDQEFVEESTEKPTDDCATASQSSDDHWPSNEAASSTYAGASRSSRVHAAGEHTSHAYPVQVMASAHDPTIDSGHHLGPRKLTHHELSRLIKRYPRGKMFDFGAEGISSSSDDLDVGDALYHIPRTKAARSAQGDGKMLSTHFPKMKQVIFLPIWDSGLSRFFALFAYHSSTFRYLSGTHDLLYCIAFTNCVMTEIDRLASMAADRQKGDFIGSISHELRSPLHGILASCEFLRDTDVTSFQQSLIDTADSCGRTLLDTINMVLDYSKINAFERNAEKAQRRAKKRAFADAPLTGKSGHLQPSLSIVERVDLSVITEEVVEGVARGQEFKGNSAGFDLGGEGSRRPEQVPSDGNFGRNVEIILEIEPRESSKSWVFVTQPGAFRRIIMNVFGNSLKYSVQGYIRVKLGVKEFVANHDGSGELRGSTIRIEIEDSGKGMSQQFLRNKLFLPFSQENSLSSGTGLGLSLVKSLVNMLGGVIEVFSTLGTGTKVVIELPMQFGTMTSSAVSAMTPIGTGSSSVSSVGSIVTAKQLCHARRAMFWRRADAIEPLPVKMLRSAIEKQLVEWFGFEIVHDFAQRPDIVLVEGSNIADFSRTTPPAGGIDASESTAIVICDASRTKEVRQSLKTWPRMETISHPVGPHKLAKAFCRCFDDKRDHDDLTTPPAVPIKIELPLTMVATPLDVRTPRSPGASQVAVDVPILHSGPVSANVNSVHSDLVLDLVRGTDGQATAKREEYPFPAVRNPDEETPNTVAGSQQTDTGSQQNPSDVAVASGEPHPNADLASNSKAAPSNPIPLSVAAVRRQPSVLLVDDNRVNLRLLQTFMTKRKYTSVYSAEDGFAAVNVYASLLNRDPPAPPDIIFLDISMPILDGFAACRQIRDAESQFQDSLTPMETPPTTLVIALTGLASARDQSEAFLAGFDLYLVKPVSFREVGRLLDSWEKNGGAATTVGVPHGALSADIVAGS